MSGSQNVLANKNLCILRLKLYWSENESDIAANGYLEFPVLCLHWVALTSDKDQREFSLSLFANIIPPLNPIKYL